MKKVYLSVIFPLLLILFSPLALADGGFFPPVYYKEDIYEPTQKGIIIFDGNTEQLIIQAAYQGNMNDFAWIIPVPSYPAINKTSSYLFEELHFLTQPDYKRAPRFGVLSPSRLMASKSEGDVTVLEQMQVGIYEATILASENPKALLGWLNSNNYHVSQEAESALNFYIQKKWHFIAMRVNLAPYDEKLIASLKNINPSISSSEDAVTILTDDIIGHIISETKYSQLTAIRATTLDYGGDDEGPGADYDNYGYRDMRRSENKPTALITEEGYNRFYEQYNGYFEDHIINEIQNKIQNKLEQQITVPDSWQCYNRYGRDIDYSKCDVWYFTQDSEEYQLLKGAECGKYCSLIEKEKNQYTMDDLAKVGAYAVANGDDRVKNYFGVTKEKGNWYDSYEDQFNNIQRQIQNKLRNSLDSKRMLLANQLTNELIKTYSKQTGSAFGNLNEIATFFSEKTLENFKQNNAFSSSYVYGSGILTNQEYAQLKSLFDGDQDKLSLKNSVETTVKNVVYWKQTAIQKKLGSGTVQPISINFKTINIVYPLKISSVNKGASEILLYVFAKYRTKVEGIENFETEYAKWIEPEDIKTDSYNSYISRIRGLTSGKIMVPPYGWSPNTYYNLNQLLDDRYFLTKLRKEMWPKEMTDDLAITQAENNKEYKLTVYEKGYALGWAGFFIGLAILWAILFGICFLPKWINNKIIRKNEKSAFYISIKRCAAYAIIIPVIAFLSSVFSNTVGRLVEKIAASFSVIFEFIFHLLNYIGLPKAINGAIILILVVSSIFFIIHLVGSFIVLLCQKLRTKVRSV